MKSKSFSFKYGNKPDLVNVDADRVLLAEIKDDKSIENLAHLYKVGKKYEDRREAIEGLVGMQENELAYATLQNALNDPFYGLRIMAIDKIDLSNANAKKAIKSIEKLASEDEKTLVRAKAISKLSKLEGAEYTELYKDGLSSNSNAIKVSSLQALYAVDKVAAMEYAASVNDELIKKSLKDALIPVYIMDQTESEIPFVAGNLMEGMFFTEDRDKQNTYKEGFQWVAASSNEEATQNLVLQQVLEVKSQSAYENKDALSKIVQDGITKLE